MNLYPQLLGLAIFTAWFLWTHEALAQRWITSPLRSPATPAILLGILGAKGLAAAGEWNRYGETLFTWGGPLAIQGAMITTGVFLGLWARLRGLRVLVILDALARALAVMIVPVRLGCVSAGCCFGRATDASWGVMDAGGVLRQPTQLLEIGLAAVLILLLHLPRLRSSRPGSATFTFLVVYGLGRAAIETLRVDTEPLLGSASYPQLIALSMLAAGLLGHLFQRSAAAQHAARPRLRRLSSLPPGPDARPHSAHVAGSAATSTFRPKSFQS